ncbi:MAG: hypothetical protein L0027_00280 [Candidatus Rokubacteria bacterium]|nr:hypothetical protein [Candidatus Rokubacteria bacterium]
MVTAHRSSPPAPAPASAARALALLVLIGLALLVGESTQPPHLHQGATAALYDEAHVLTTLESLPGDAPLPAPAAVTALAAVAPAPPLPARAPRAAPATRYTDPRAPPRA